MARFTDEEINRIKQEVSLVRLAEAKGFELKPHGKHYAIHCPFHPDDKTPSLMITPEINLFNCLACGASGSPIDWVMKIEGVSTRHALELLVNDLPGLAAESNEAPKVVKKASKQKLPSVLSASADHQTALRQVIDYYHDTLKASPEALDYLDKRGLKNAELIDTFKLGYANRTLAYRLPQSNRQEGAEIRGQLKDIGILRESTGHEHFNGCLVVPVMDVNGAITEVYGRKLLGKRLRGYCAQHLYLPGPHEGVWNAEAVKASTEIILCEALIDAMTFWAHGFKNVTASYGTGGFTEDHLNIFLNSGVKRVLIAYDRDEAGNKAAEQLSAKLQSAGLECFRVLFPKGMDANSYALAMTPARKSLEMVIRKAEWLGKGKAPNISTEASAELVAIAALAEENPVESISSEANRNNEDQSISLLAAKEKAASTEEPLPASPIPTLAADNVRCTVKEHEVLIDIGGRVYRVRGLAKNTVHDLLKITLMACNENGFHTDTLDLYNAKQRQIFINQASVELGVKDETIKKDLGKVLLKLEGLQEEQISTQLKPKSNREGKTLNSDEHQAALELLQDKNLLQRILTDFTAAGVVGEETNKLAGYLACVSRKLEKPLAVMVQSTSAAGKSSLMDAILKFMPEEERVQYSAMTGQSLFYMGETNLKNKILAIAEEEGAHNASYALKLLQSEGEVTIASTGKDATTGNLVTQEYRVEGPTQLFMTTTAIDVDPELLNRCLVLSVDEGRAQTEAIHEQQRFAETLEGLFAKEERQEIIGVHRNAQRLLKPLEIVNPYAKHLKFVSDKTRTRRDHQKYLTLIRTITLLHQYQRHIKTGTHKGKTLAYIEVTLNDIEYANQIAHEVLGRTLDELPPQTRRLLKNLTDLVKTECQAQHIEQHDYRFKRRALMDRLGWTYEQVRVHLQRLIDHEYVLVHRGGRGQSFEYELLYSGGGEDGSPFLMGLIDVTGLRKAQGIISTTVSLGGKKAEFGVLLGAHCGAIGVGLGSEEIAENTDKNSEKYDFEGKSAENARLGCKKLNGQSYRNDSAVELGLNV